MGIPAKMLELLMKQGPLVAGSGTATVAGGLEAVTPSEDTLHLLERALLSSPAAGAIDTAAKGIKGDLNNLAEFGDALAGVLTTGPVPTAAAAEVPNPRLSKGKITSGDVVGAALAELAMTPQSSPTPVPVVPPSKGTASQMGLSADRPADVAFYKDILAKAYPDTDFNISSDGRTVTLGERKKTVDAATLAGVSPEFNPAANLSGIAQMREALTKATTDTEKLDIALRLQDQLAQQQVHNYNKYKADAEIEYGVSEIQRAIEELRAFEAVDPNNPRNGLPSNQRLALMQQLGAARGLVSTRIKDLMEGDVPLKTAESLVKVTLMGLQKEGILGDKEAKREARTAQLTEVLSNPTLVNRIAAIRQGNAAPDDAARTAIANQVVDGKIKLTQDEQLLATATPEGLLGYLEKVKDPEQRAKTYQVLYSDELKKTGNEQVAKANLALLKRAMEVDMDAPEIAAAFPGLASKWKQLSSTAALGGAMDADGKADLANKKMGLRRELLNMQVQNIFQGAVQTWDGAIKADPVAKELIAKNADKPYGAQQFISDYLRSNSALPMTQRIQALRTLTRSATEAWPQSAILGQPNPDAMAGFIDRMAVQAIGQSFANLDGSSWAAYGESYRNAVLQTQRKN